MHTQFKGALYFTHIRFTAPSIQGCILFNVCDIRVLHSNELLCMVTAYWPWKKKFGGLVETFLPASLQGGGGGVGLKCMKVQGSY